MKSLKTLERLQQLHILIYNENSGSPNDIAKLMQISERRIHHLIQELKIMGAKICYSRTRCTYYYCEHFDLKVMISVTVINKDETTQIFGGSYFLRHNNESNKLTLSLSGK